MSSGAGLAELIEAHLFLRAKNEKVPFDKLREAGLVGRW
jgi:hypothetical protein